MTVTTGMDPQATPCPRCGKRIGTIGVGRFGVQAKHKRPDGRPCRLKRLPGGKIAEGDTNA